MVGYLLGGLSVQGQEHRTHAGHGCSAATVLRLLPTLEAVCTSVGQAHDRGNRPS